MNAIIAMQRKKQQQRQLLFKGFLVRGTTAPVGCSARRPIISKYGQMQ